jgi:hypothetical protein
MAGKSLKQRVSDFKKKVAGEGTHSDPKMTWVDESSGNVTHGRLLGLHVPDDQRPYYRVQLMNGCKVLSKKANAKSKKSMHASVGMIVSLWETDDLSCLRYFIDEMAINGAFFDVWIRWKPFRQEVHVKKIESKVTSKIEEGGRFGEEEDLDHGLS